MKYIQMILFTVSGLLVLSACSNADTQSSTNASGGFGVIAENNIPLGDIPIMGGTVEANFTVTNEGNEDMVLMNGTTSCMCTEAIVQAEDGIKSPRIQMQGHGPIANIRQKLSPGESANVIATFDPLAHGPNAIGAIKRDVFITTDSDTTPTLRFSFWGEVVK